MKGKEKIVLFAKELVVSEQRINPSTGRTEVRKYNTLDPLKEHKISYFPMPMDFVLKAAKNDQKELKLSDLGVYILASIDDQGHISNDYLGKNFRKPTPIDLNTLLSLRALFVNDEPEKKPELEQ